VVCLRRLVGSASYLANSRSRLSLAISGPTIYDSQAGEGNRPRVDTTKYKSGRCPIALGRGERGDSLWSFRVVESCLVSQSQPYNAGKGLSLTSRRRDGMRATTSVLDASFSPRHRTSDVSLAHRRHPGFHLSPCSEPSRRWGVRTVSFYAI